MDAVAPTAPGTCAQCGGTNPAGAMNCQWCQAALPHPAPIGEELLRTDAELPDPNPVYYPPTPALNLPWGRIGIVLVVVIIVLVAVAVAQSASNPSSSTPSPPPGETVSVSLLSVSSPDDACGMGSAQGGAFTAPAHAQHLVTWNLPLHGASVPCEVASVASGTPGFSVSGNVPLLVRAPATPLTVTVYCPAAYNGGLELIIK